MTPELIALPDSSSAERVRLMSMDLIRDRALERLYERRDAVSDLICALERYQRSRQTRVAQCVPFNPVRKCQSGFAQSRI